MWSSRVLPHIVLVAAACIASCSAGCDRGNTAPVVGSPSTAPTAAAAVVQPTVASLVPAATDLILSMGLRDHLVAVSTYDQSRPGAAGLPAVGDYLTVDWEMLARVAPRIMLAQVNPERLPAGFTQRAADLHIQLANLKIDRLADVYITIADLGNLLHEPDAADRAIRQMRTALELVRDQQQSSRPISALLVLDDGSGDGVNLVGPRTFLDDLLAVAGGQNAAATLGQPYPSVDPETLASMHCDVAILLMPGMKADAAQAAVIAWRRAHPSVAQRVTDITDPDALLPGGRVADIAQLLADALHGTDHQDTNPQSADRSTTAP